MSSEVCIHLEILALFYTNHHCLHTWSVFISGGGAGGGGDHASFHKEGERSQEAAVGGR